MCFDQILYGDEITGSMKYAIEETERRRRKQIIFNKKNNISPKTIKNKITDILEDFGDNKIEESDIGKNKKTIKQHIEEITKEMEQAAINLEFEEAAKLRDRIKFLQKKELGLLSIIKK